VPIEGTSRLIRDSEFWLARVSGVLASWRN
jgi:hypothetical protein